MNEFIPVYIPGIATAVTAPLIGYNIHQLTKRKPHKTSAGDALEQLADALDKRVADIAPDNPVGQLGLSKNVPTGDPREYLKTAELFAGNGPSQSNPRDYNVSINPNADRVYLAHELGHIASDSTPVGHAIRSTSDNKMLGKALLAAGILGAGGAAVLTPGDDDMLASIGLATAASLPTIADEFLASKNALSIMDTAGMRASMGQKGKLAGGFLSYLAAPVVGGGIINSVGNIFDEDVVMMPE